MIDIVEEWVKVHSDKLPKDSKPVIEALQTMGAVCWLCLRNDLIIHDYNKYESTDTFDSEVQLRIHLGEKYKLSDQAIYYIIKPDKR